MDLRQLRHFIAVADLGNFSRAAERVCLTQPALTRSIKTLEDEIDARLFDRKSSGVELTSAGTALLEHARIMVSEQERAQQRITLAKRGLGEELVVAICPLQWQDEVRAVVAQFARENTSVSLRIVEGHVDDTIQPLLDRKIDLVFTTVPATTMTEKLAYERLMSTPISIVAAPSHPLARRLGITPADLSRWTWAMLDQKHALSGMRNYFALGNSGLPTGGVKTQSVPYMTSLILKEGMVGMLPTALVEDFGLVALDVTHQPRGVRAGLLFRTDEPLKRSAELFAEALRARIGSPGSDESNSVQPIALAV
jgi:DNA-binding transcriptional LysR family regulator